MNKVIFLDIDGPVIPEPCYYTDLKCSMDRSVVSTLAIGYLNKLCLDLSAKIVLNSSHNYHVTKPIGKSNGHLKEDLIAHGLKEQHFHKDCYTLFPYISDTDTFDHPRLAAIKDWLNKNGNPKWVCFDDENFTSLDNLILVDFSKGITNENFLQAYKLFNRQPSLLIIG